MGGLREDYKKSYSQQVGCIIKLALSQAIIFLISSLLNISISLAISPLLYLLLVTGFARDELRS